VANDSVLVEIVEAFCALNRSFTIHEAQDIGRYMDKTFFNTSVGLKTAMFSCLTICLRARALETTEQKQALAFFSLLAHSTLRFAAGFTLNIRIEESTTKMYLVNLLDGQMSASGSFVGTFVNIIKAVRPISAYVKELGCGRRVDVRLRIRSLEEVVNISIGEEEMGWSQERWIVFLRAVVI
jgi:hypothetical protein